jgi:hypothetical protein
MAAKKKKKATKTKSPARAAKAKKAPARKTSAKKTKVKAKAKKATKKTVARKPAKKSGKTVKASRKPAAKKTAKKAAKKKQIVGEGDYQASRTFLKDQSDFVKKNKAAIPAMGKDAERALDGPEGDALREAEASAAARSRDTF